MYKRKATNAVVRYLENFDVTLSTKGAENQAEGFGASSTDDGVVPRSIHQIKVVLFASEFARVRVVLIGGHGGVLNHDGFQVKATVAQVAESARSQWLIRGGG